MPCRIFRYCPYESKIARRTAWAGSRITISVARLAQKLTRRNRAWGGWHGILGPQGRRSIGGVVGEWRHGAWHDGTGAARMARLDLAGAVGATGTSTAGARGRAAAV